LIKDFTHTIEVTDPTRQWIVDPGFPSAIRVLSSLVSSLSPGGVRLARRTLCGS
jgi:hypothetical protein